MAGGRRIPVTVEADVDGSFDRAARGLDDVAKSADGADKKLSTLTKGHQALDTEIDKTAHSVKALREEFARTGDIDLLKDARKIDNARKGLERLKKDFSDAGGQSGEGFASNFAESISDIGPQFVSKGLKAAVANPEIAGIGAAAAAPIAAGLASALSGAALAGTAAVGIAGGIVLAARSDAVRSAWSTFGHDALGQLQDAASSFEQPLVRAAHTFGDEIERDLPAIRKDFQILSPLVDDLAVGAAGFVHELQPGLADAFKGAVPVIKEISHDLPKLGSDASFFFSQLGEAGTAGADALSIAIDGVGLSVDTLGLGLKDSATAFELFSGGTVTATSHLLDMKAVAGGLTGGLMPALGDLMGDNSGKAKDFGQSVDDLKRKLDETGQDKAFTEGMQFADQAMRDGRQAAKDLQDQLSSLARQILGGKDADLSFKQGRLDMIDTLKQSKGAIGDNTEAGLKAQQVLVGQAEKAVAVRDAVLQQTGSVEAADKAYDSHIQQLYKDAQANGYTKDKVDGVIGSLNSIPKPNPVDIELKRQGYSDDDLRELKRSGLSLPPSVDTTVTVRYNTYHNDIYDVVHHYDSPSDVHFGLAKGGVRTAAGIRAAAVGTVIPPSDPGTVLTGEPQTGGEVLTPLRGISQARAMQLTSLVGNAYDFDVVPRSGYAAPVTVPRGAGGGGSRVYNVNVNVPPTANPAEVGAVVVEAIHAYERNNGSGWRS